MSATKPSADQHNEEMRDEGREEIRDKITSRLDELIWRRKLLDKPVDVLEEILEMVEAL